MAWLIWSIILLCIVGFLSAWAFIRAGDCDNDDYYDDHDYNEPNDESYE